MRFFAASVIAFFCISCGSTNNEQTSYLQALKLRYEGPDLNLTPGDLCDINDRDFKGYRHSEQLPVCKRNVDSNRKDAVAAQYGVSPRERRNRYEIDHFIPLSIGGNNGFKNLWPLVSPHARLKSKYEQYIFDEVSAGRMLQAEAIDRIHAWTPENHPFTNERL